MLLPGPSPIIAQSVPLHDQLLTIELSRPIPEAIHQEIYPEIQISGQDVEGSIMSSLSSIPSRGAMWPMST